MGMMLETTSRRLFDDPHGAHFGSPDKDPDVRLRVLEDAGRSTVPFTTGILIGIGETLAERVDSLFAIRRVAREYGGIQEVIVQNFRAKPDTAMARQPDAELDDLAATVAVARLVLGPADAHPGAAEPDRRRVRAAARAPASTTGAASRRSRPTTSTRSGPGRRSRSWPRGRADAGFRLASG